MKPNLLTFDLGKDRTPEPRQTRYSRKLRELGKCWCGKPTNGKSLCAEHLKAQAQRMRRRAA